MVSLFRCTWLAALVLALAISPALAQPTWVPQRIGPVPGSGEAMDINNVGDIVGYTDAGAFVWTRSMGMQPLGTLGGSTSLAYGVNDARQVVGEARTAAGRSHAFIWTAGAGMVDLGTLGGTFSRAKAINNRGEVVGEWAVTDTSTYRPFYWSPATGMVDLTGALGVSGYTFLYDINDAGQVVGGDGSGTFVWSPSGGRVSVPAALTLAINNAAQVTGTHAAGSRPFVWTAASGFADVPTPSVAFAQAIDDRGLVALSYYPFGTGAGTGVGVSSVGGTFAPLSTASGDWRGFPRAISAAGVVGRADGGPYFWCRGGAPAIGGAAATPDVLQPANGQLVTVRVDYTATGRCGSTSNFLEVESSEPDEGNPDGLPDFIVVDTHSVRLRAEHRAQSSGRTYTIRIRATDEYGYSATQTVTVSVPASGGGGGGAMTGVTLTPNLTSPQPVGSQIIVSAAGSGGTPPYSYRFWVQPWATATWQVLCDWSTTSSCAWTPAGTGGYDLAVEARRSTFTSGSEVQAAISYQITSGSGGGGGPMTGVSLSTNVAPPQPVSTAIVLSASGSGGTAPYSYRFWIQSWSTGAWELVRDWSPAASYTWTPIAAGGYNLAVESRSSGASVAEVQNARSYEIAGGGSGGGGGGGTGGGGTMTGVSLSTNVPSPQAAGTGIILSGSGTGGTQPYSYRFWVQALSTGAWQVLRDWSTTATHTWIPTSAGGYNLAVEARGAGATAPEVQSAIGYSVTSGNIATGTMTGVTLSAGAYWPQPLGNAVTWTAVGQGGSSPYEYRFWIQPWDGAWQIAQDWSTTSTWTWRAVSAGGYNVAVEARSRGATAPQVQDAQVFVLTAP